MIGNVAGTGRGFGGLARYLKSGKVGENAERCSWIEGRNICTDDPEAAARVMRATANKNHRCENPVYHYSLSWDPSDPFTNEKAREAADHSLRTLGLQDHQALVFCHTDRDHPHIHIMVNRVHPEERTAWRNGHDYAKLEKACREIERDHGLRVVPGPHHQIEGHERPEYSRLTNGEKRQQERTGETPFKDRLHHAAASFAESRDWQDLHGRLSKQGLSLQKTGRGLTVTDGQQQAKCSALDRGYSLMNLEKRFGEYKQMQPERSRPAGTGTQERERAGKTRQASRGEAYIHERNALDLKHLDERRMFDVWADRHRGEAEERIASTYHRKETEATLAKAQEALRKAEGSRIARWTGRAGKVRERVQGLELTLQDIGRREAEVRGKTESTIRTRQESLSRRHTIAKEALETRYIQQQRAPANENYDFGRERKREPEKMHRAEPIRAPQRQPERTRGR